jgi:dolichyldiphosphatase
MIITALTIAYSRVYLNYHTINQILVGSFLGCTNALVYYSIVSKLKGFWDWIVTGKIGQMLSLRNGCDVQNILVADRQARLVNSSNKEN